MSIIYCDIDNTIFDFEREARSLLRDLALESDDKRLLRASYTRWDEWSCLSDLVGSEITKIVVDKIHSDEFIDESVIDYTCIDVLNRIDRREHSLRFITNRDLSCQGATEEMLSNYGIIFDCLICTKGEKKFFTANGQYLIDDRPKNLIDFVYGQGRDRFGFGLLTDWNRNLTDVDRVYLSPDWRGLGKYFEEFEII